MPAPKGLPSFVRVGADAISELQAMSTIFLKIEVGKPIEIIPIHGVDKILSFKQHAIWLDEGDSPMFPCFGENWCPGEVIGNKAKFRALLICVTADEPERQRILPMGSSLYKQISDIEDASGRTIAGSIIRIGRTGQQLSTKYTAVATGRTKKSVAKMKPEFELIEHIGPTDPEEVVEMLKKAGVWSKSHNAIFKPAYSAYLASLAPAAAEDDEDEDEDDEDTIEEIVVETVKPAKKVAAPVEDEDDDIEDGDDDEDDVEEDEVEEVVPAKPVKPVKPAKKAAAPVVVDEDAMEDIDE